MFGSDTLTPEMLMALGGGIMQGSNLGTGLGTGLQNASTVMATQKQNAEVKASENKTREWLQKQFPNEDLSQVPPETLRTYANQAIQQRFAKPEKPKFQVINGKLVKIDETTGENSVVGDYSEPKLPDPTSIQRDLQAAGLQPGTPEYKQAILEHYRKSGTMVDVSPDGTVRFIQGDLNATKPVKTTEAQDRNAGFYLRAQRSDEILTKELDPELAPGVTLDAQGTSERNRFADNVPVVGNYIRSKEGQQYQQAKDDFITAVLRRESGAVIGETEYAREDRKYFPQPNDGPEVIEQKRQARKAAIEGLKIGSGPAADKIDQPDENADPFGIR